MHSRRRDIIKRSAGLAALLATGSAWAPFARAEGGWNRAAFAGRTVDEVLKAFGAGKPVESKDVSLAAPDIAENGAVVPVAAGATLPGVKRLLFLVERNPNLLVASFEFLGAVEPSIATRIKMAESSKVYAIVVTADNRVLYAQKDVKVTLGGCGGDAGPPQPTGEPTRIRAQVQGGGVLVRTLMSHEMESGQRTDPSGRTVPAWHITEVTATLNGKPVLAAQWGPGVARNPFMQFSIAGAKAGDTIGIDWADNRGERRSDEAQVS